MTLEDLRERLGLRERLQPLIAPEVPTGIGQDNGGTLVMGTRGSPLALTQTNWVRTHLRAWYPNLTLETRIIKTTGDQRLDVTPGALGGKGVFVKEIEEALLRGEVDLAVHSLKDLPTETPPGLCLAALPPREDPHDVLVINAGIQNGPITIGTSSLRRRAQLLNRIAELEVVDLRGNVDTRIRKMREQRLAGIVLAAAGLRRLGRFEDDCWLIPYEVMLPAPGQGALALECRSDDDRVRDLVAALEHPATRHCVTAERAFLRRLQGGCNVPLGGLAESRTDGTLRLEGVLATPDGKWLVRREATGSDPEDLGVAVAELLLDDGGDEILRTLRMP